MKINVVNKDIGFVGIVSDINLKLSLTKDDIKKINDALDNLTVLIFKKQNINDQEQLDFSKNFGQIETAKNNTNVTKSNERRISDSFGDVSNLDKNNKPFKKNDNRRFFALGNQLWHTDASFKKIPALYSILSGRKVSKKGGETQFCDMRAAYDSLETDMKEKCNKMICHHSLQYSRAKLGFIMKDVLSADELKNFIPVKQPMVRTNVNTNRKSLFLASHIGLIEGMEIPHSLLFINDLIEHCTKEEFTYTHHWNDGDVIIWDNRQVMHRGRPYDDLNEIRDMRRTTISGREMLIKQ